MGNPMFDRTAGSSPAKGGGLAGLLFNRMYNSNPAFRDFANSMKGLSEDEMVKKCGADPNAVAQAKKDPASFFSQNGLM